MLQLHLIALLSVCSYGYFPPVFNEWGIWATCIEFEEFFLGVAGLTNHTVDTTLIITEQKYASARLSTFGHSSHQHWRPSDPTDVNRATNYCFKSAESSKQCTGTLLVSNKSDKWELWHFPRKKTQFKTSAAQTWHWADQLDGWDDFLFFYCVLLLIKIQSSLSCSIKHLVNFPMT